MNPPWLAILREDRQSICSGVVQNRVRKCNPGTPLLSRIVF